MKKVLMNASVASMIYKFNMSNIDILIDMGYQVDVACNFGKENPMKQEDINKFKDILRSKNIRVFEIDCPRKIFSIFKIIKSYFQLKKIINKENYHLIHTQSPIGGVVCRLAARKARKNGTKVIYTAHGFHFFKGAPIINWLIFYPVEKLFSKFSDLIITINKEDFRLARTSFYSQKVEYIPGVGVDIDRFKNCIIKKNVKRDELGIQDNALVLLSVGELSSRKNHQVVIKALKDINDELIYYLIVGKGKEYRKYKKLSTKFGISKRVILLGPRNDIDELCRAADIFVHPSIREGLGIAALEGMAAGLPLMSSYIGGIRDYTEDGVTGCCINDPLDVNEVKNAIMKLKSDITFREQCGKNNRKIVEDFSIESSKNRMKLIYEELSKSY